jgi:hypothetical protein
MIQRSAVAGLVFLTLAGCGGMVRQGSLIQVRREFGDGNFKQCVAKVDNARRWFDDSTPPTPTEDAELLFYKGQCLDLDGRKAEAAVYYERLIGKYPATDWGLQAAARLNENRSAGK